MYILSLIHILTRIIRESGVMNGALTTEYKSADAVRADAALMEKIKAYTVKDAVDSAVSYTHLDVYKRQLWDGETRAACAAAGVQLL